MRTITKAIKLLSYEEIHEVSMDFDVSVLISIGNGPQKEIHSEETFEAVALFIYAAFEVDSFPLEIHSINEEAEKIFSHALPGWSLTYNPLPQETHSQVQEIIPEEELSDNRVLEV